VIDVPRVPETKRLLLIGACWGLLLPAIARAEFGFDAGAGFAYDDNLSNGLEAEDRKASGAITANVSGDSTNNSARARGWA
jgi:hypothetical protein